MRRFAISWSENDHASLACASCLAVKLGKDMGIYTWAAFAGSDDSAVVDRDFAMHENDLQTVLKCMRADGVNISRRPRLRLN